MKRSVYSRVAITVVVTLLAIGMTAPLTAVAQSHGEDEPNDTQMAATVIGDTSLKGELATQGGVDWFAKEFNKGETVSFALTKSLEEPGLDVTLYAPNGTAINNSPASDGVGKTVVSATASQSGEYAIKIEPIHTKAHQIPYTVYAPAKEAPAEEQPAPLKEGIQQANEPNNKWQNAESIEHKQVSGGMSDDSETDWYSFQAEEGQQVSIVFKKPTDSTFHVDVYGPDLTDHFEEDLFIGMDDKREQVTLTVNRTGRHYITLDDIYINNSDYEIELHKEPSQQSDAAETEDAPDPTESSGSNTAQSTDPASQADREADQQGDTTGATTEADENGTNLFGPGFTSGGAVVALFVTALFALRRR